MSVGNGGRVVVARLLRMLSYAFHFEVLQVPPPGGYHTTWWCIGAALGAAVTYLIEAEVSCVGGL